MPTTGCWQTWQEMAMHVVQADAARPAVPQIPEADSLDKVRRDFAKLRARADLTVQSSPEPDLTITPFQAFCLPMAYGIAVNVAVASAWIQSFDMPGSTHRLHDAGGDEFLPEQDLLSSVH